MALIIVGIDPGTTTAIAILDVEGMLLEVRSSRVHDAAGVISQIIAIGRPVLVGCDKRNPPSAVAAIATKLGARLVSPQDDLKKEEKRSIVKYVEGAVANEHELDALAAARFAFDSYKQLFAKVHRVLEKNGKLGWKDAVIQVMVQDDELNIVEALLLCEFRAKREERRHDEVRRVHDTKEPRKLMDQLLAKDAQMESIREENILVKARLRRMERLLEKKPGILQETPQAGLLKKVEQAGRERDSVQQELDNVRSIIASLDENTLVVKKVQNFSLQEFRKKAWLRPFEGAVLAVVHPEVASDEVVKSMGGKVILTKHVPKEKKGMAFVNMAALDVQDHGDFLIIKRGELDRELKARSVLADVVKEYKKERTQ